MTDFDFSAEELHADVSPTIGDLHHWLENTNDKPDSDS